MNAAMSLPQKRRGLSPEGRKIRERAQGTLHVGGYGGPMFPTGRRKKNDFVHDNIERLQEIQAKCKQHSAPGRREPLKAIRDTSVKVDPVAVRKNKNEGQLVSVSRADERRQQRGISKTNGFEGNGRKIGSGSTTHSDYYSLSDDHDDNIENTQTLSPYGRSQMAQEKYQAFTADGESRPGSGLLNPIKNTIMQNLRDAKNDGHFSRNSLKNNRNKGSIKQQQDVPNTALSMLPRTTRAERRAHVSQVISKIKTQRPACEIDYNKYCRELENQHRLLLSPEENMSMYGTTVDGSIAGRNSQRNNGSIRARSCSTDRDSLISRRNSSRQQQQHAPKQYPASSQPQQEEQLPRRFSRSTSNLSSVRSQVLKTPLERSGSNLAALQNGTDRRRMSNQLETEKNPLPSLSRSKSNMEGRRRANSMSSNRNADKNYLNVDHAQETDRLSYASRDLEYYNDNKNIKNKQVWGTPRQMRLDDLNVTDATENNEKLNGNASRSYRHNGHNYNDTYEDNTGYVDNNYEHSGSTSGVDVDESGSIYYENNFEDDHQETVRTLRTTHNDHENTIIPSSRNGLNYSRNEDFGTSHDYPEDNYEDTDQLEAYDGRSDGDDQEYGNNYQDLRTYTPASTVQQETRPEMQSRSSMRRSRSQQREIQQLQKKNQDKKEKLEQQERELKQKQKPKHKIGSLPKYLQNRKEQQARQDAVDAAKDPQCPEGHTVLDDAERRNTLHLLKKSQAEVMRDISSLPVANDTLRLRKHRDELEEKLNQIEEGLAIFSQPKVYVLNDEYD